MFNNIPPNGFPQIPDIEDLEAVVEDVKTLKTTAAVHAVAITGLENNKDDTTNIAPTFSADSNYSVGDLVYYEGTLYECTTAHEATAWDAEDFTAATIAGEINGLNSKFISDIVLSFYGTHDSAPFEENGSGVVFTIKDNGTVLGYLVMILLRLPTILPNLHHIILMQ